MNTASATEPQKDASRAGVVIHSTAVVAPSARIGEGTKIWCFCQVRERATLGRDCILGKGVYVDLEVNIGNSVKIQNNVSVYHGVTIESAVFVGPHVCFTNDRVPRAITPTGEQKALEDWDISPTLIRYGASLGAHSVILPGIVIGRFAMAGSGSVVTRDVPDFGLVVGNPARVMGWVCACGKRAESQLAARVGCGQCDWPGELELERVEA